MIFKAVYAKERQCLLGNPLKIFKAWDLVGSFRSEGKQQNYEERQKKKDGLSYMFFFILETWKYFMD